MNLSKYKTGLLTEHAPILKEHRAARKAANKDGKKVKPSAELQALEAHIDAIQRLIAAGFNTVEEVIAVLPKPESKQPPAKG